MAASSARWSPTAGWRELTNVPATPMYTADPQGVVRADNHGWFIATSGGKVLQAGPSKQMNWMTTTGSGTITPAGNRGNSADAMNGNAVYYDISKIITMGGAPAYRVRIEGVTTSAQARNPWCGESRRRTLGAEAVNLNEAPSSGF